MVSVSPLQGPIGTTFSEPGWGFTPNGIVTLTWQKPTFGGETLSKRADQNGTYDHSFTLPEGYQLGTWTYWGVDETTGIASNRVSYKFTEPAVDVTPNQVAIGVKFRFQGSGFTPRGGVTMNFRSPGGSLKTVPMAADMSGNYSTELSHSAGAELGIWTHWGVDDTTGTASKQVIYNLTR